MGERLQGWLRLESGDRILCVILILLLVPLHALLATAGYTRTKRWLERTSARSDPRTASQEGFDDARNLVRLGAIAGRYGVVDATCLRQSLLIHFLLRRKGLAPAIRIGVRRQDGIFDAHAWVELDGIALGQGDLAHTPMPDPPLHRGSA